MERLVYKTTEEGELTMLFWPGSQPNAPVLYWIHGGGWCGGSAEKAASALKKVAFTQLLQAGWAMAAVNYRLIGEKKQIRFDDLMQDILDGLCWLSERAEELSIDPQRIVTAGASAGGHLSLMVALASDTFCPRKPFRVILGIDMSGPTDLTDLSCCEGNWFCDEMHRLTDMLIGSENAAHTQPARRRASPLYYVTPQSPPVVIIHGTHDTVVPIAQSDRLLERLRACDVPVMYCPITGGEHDWKGYSDKITARPSLQVCMQAANAWAQELAEAAK